MSKGAKLAEGHTARGVLENEGLVVLIISCLHGFLQELLVLVLLLLAVAGVGYSSGLLWLTTPALWLLSIQQCGILGIGSSLEWTH
jgi:hypothetical protein